MTLKPCPCGETPEQLHVEAQMGDRPKYSHAWGSCCNEWIVEFYNGYDVIGGDRSTESAKEAWNGAKRGES